MAVAIVAVDQLVKMLVARGLPPGASVPLVPGILSLTHVHNRGVAFGLFAGLSPAITLAVVLILVLILTYNKGRQLRSRVPGAGVALMVGGAAGNLIDRIRLGFVVDYLDVHIWPVFNLADAAIVVGAGLVLLMLARQGPAHPGGEA